jgi:hypothetical protein
MRTGVRWGAVVVLLMIAAACGDSGLLRRLEHVSPRPLPAPPPTFPPLSGASRTFNFARELSYRVSEYTKASRFVLYDNGAFVLQSGAFPLNIVEGTTRRTALLPSSGTAPAPPTRGARPARSERIR